MKWLHFFNLCMVEICIVWSTYQFISLSLFAPSLSLSLLPSNFLIYPQRCLRQRQNTAPKRTRKRKIHIKLLRLTVICSHHASLQSEPQHHDFPGDPTRGSSGAVLWLVCPAQSLWLCPLQWQSTRSAAFILEIRLILPGSGV